MQLTVKTIEGAVHVVSVDDGAYVRDLKGALVGATGVASATQRIIFRGKVLADDQPLSSYAIADGCTLHLVQKPPPPSPAAQSPSQSQSPQSQAQPQTRGPPLPPMGAQVDLQAAMQQALGALSQIGPIMQQLAAQTGAPVAFPISVPAFAPQQPQQQQQPQPQQQQQQTQASLEDILQQTLGLLPGGVSSPQPPQQQPQQPRERGFDVMGHLMSQLQRGMVAEGGEPQTMRSLLRETSRLIGEEEVPPEKMSAGERLLSEVMDTMSIPELMQVLQGDWRPMGRMHETLRSWMTTNLGNGTPPTDQQLADFAALLVSELSGHVHEESLPPEIVARVKPGSSFARSIMDPLEFHVGKIVRMVAAAAPDPDNPESFAEALRKSTSVFVVDFVDSIAAALVGGVGDVEVVIRYFLYNNMVPLGQQMAFMSSNMLTQTIMQTYNRAKITQRQEAAPQQEQEQQRPQQQQSPPAVAPAPESEVGALMARWETVIAADVAALQQPAGDSSLSEAYKAFCKRD